VTAYLPTGTVSSSGQISVFNTINGDQLATTGSNTFTAPQTISDTTNSTSYLDGALHVAGGMSVRKDVRISGSMTINGLLTAVSMSTQYVTSSEYVVGTSRITLNDDDNVRFAGLSIIDSGSASPTSASIFWDSLKHKFIYENLSGSAYNSAIFIAGPKNTGSLGDEVGLTTDYIPVATGDDHIANSIIYQNTSQGRIGIGGTSTSATLSVTGNIDASSGITGSGIQSAGVMNIISGNTYKINNTDVLSANTLGSGVVNSSLTSVGTLTSLTVSGDLTVDTSTLKVDSTNNRVGIGTTSPITGFALDVYSNTEYVGLKVRNFSHAYVSIEAGQANLQSILELKSPSKTCSLTLNTDNRLYLSNGSNSLILDASGNLGLGVTPSAWTSNVKAIELANGVSLHAYSAATTPILYMGANFYDNGTNRIYKTTAAATLYQQTAGEHRFFNAPSGTAGDPITFTQAMTLDASGNLLVGTTSTGADGIALNNTTNYSWVEGSGNSYANIFRQRNTAATVIASGYKRSATGLFASSYGISMTRAAIAIGYINGSIAFFSDSATNVANGTDASPTERMTILNNGNVGIGTTNPAAPLHVASENNNNDGTIKLGVRGWLQHRDAGNTILSLANDYNSDSAKMEFRMKGNATSDAKMTILGNGNVGIGTPSPTRKLHVMENALFTNQGTDGGKSYVPETPILTVTTDGDGGTTPAYASNAVFRVGIGGGSTGNVTTERFRVNLNGRVGIGTTNPNTLFHVQGSGYINDGLGIGKSANARFDVLGDFDRRTASITTSGGNADIPLPDTGVGLYLIAVFISNDVNNNFNSSHLLLVNTRSSTFGGGNSIQVIASTQNSTGVSGEPVSQSFSIIANVVNFTLRISAGFGSGGPLSVVARFIKVS
jgi:hypothetical protein